MSTKYFELAPSDIIQDINYESLHQKVIIRGIEFWVHPNVYPSDRFRSSHFILETIESIVSGKTVCDMGCGMGIIGQFALRGGAKRVVQADINPFAIENAKANRELHEFSAKQLSIFESDCFDNVPPEIFDLIIFNIPFHSEPVILKNPLERAFHDPGFCSVSKFLKQASFHSDRKTQVLIVFSNKGNVKLLESKFDESKFSWTLEYVTNRHEAYDSRIYVLKLK